MRIISKLLALFVAMCLISGFAFSQVVINEYSGANYSQITDNNGEYSDWVELYNAGGATVDLTGYHLSDKESSPTKWVFPSGITIAAGAYKLIWLSSRDVVSGGNIHTNFKLTQCKASEDIVFADAGGVILDMDSINLTNQKNHSRGRTTNGGSTWSVFTSPTPGYSNASPKNEYVPTPQFSLNGGYYSGAQSLIITCADGSATIRYTTNGSEPTSGSTIYSSPINISATTVVRARAFSPDPNTPASFVETNTYLIDVTHTVYILSICGDQVDDLLNGGGGNPEGHFEIYDASGALLDEGNGEYNKHGNDSWAYPQRGFDYIMRDQFGINNAVNYPVFTASPRDEYQRLIVKAAANDNFPFSYDGGAPGNLGGAHIRDSYCHALSQMADLHVDERTHESGVVYLNGAYWGVYDIREKVDDHDYTQYYYNTGQFDLQFIKTWGGTWAEYGGNQALTDWTDLKNFIVSNDMSLQPNWDYMDSLYNWKSLADYVVLNSYIVTTDWLNWNTAWWRGLNPGADKKKWRYALWDQDATFNHYINYTGLPNTYPDADPCNADNLGDPGGEGHIPVLNALFDNPIFEQWYISRYIDMGNTYFSCDFMIPLLDSLVGVIDPEMPAHCTLWGPGNAGNGYNDWLANVQDMRDFINDRCVMIDQGMIDCYQVTGPYPITFIVDPPNMGNEIQINSIQPTTYPFNGDYFGNIDILLKSKPYTAGGWTFDYWESNSNGFNPNTTDSSVSMNITSGDTVIAHFTQDNQPLPTYDVTVIIEPANAGDVTIEGVTPPSYPFLSNYTSGIVVDMTENPNPNYQFEYWEMGNHLVNPNSTNQTVNFTIFDQDTVIAHYKNLVGIEYEITNSSWLNVYPTLVTNDLSIEYTLTRSMEIEISLFDVNGKMIADLLSGNSADLTTGSHKLNFNLQEYNITPGVYFVRFRTPYEDRNEKVVFIPR